MEEADLPGQRLDSWNSLIIPEQALERRGLAASHTAGHCLSQDSNWGLPVFITPAPPLCGCLGLTLLLPGRLAGMRGDRLGEAWVTQFPAVGAPEAWELCKASRMSIAGSWGGMEGRLEEQGSGRSPDSATGSVGASGPSGTLESGLVVDSRASILFQTHFSC